MEQIAAKKKKNTRILSHKASENRPPRFSTVYEGLFKNPYQAAASSSSSSSSSKPPLLPLPIVPLSRNYSLPCATRSLSFSCPNRNPPFSPPKPTRSGPIRKHPKYRPNTEPKPKPKPTDRPGSEPGFLFGGFEEEEFSLKSPPPSSLPLPRFAMRPKMIVTCNAEAVGVGVDAGATDSLRRILRLP